MLIAGLFFSGCTSKEQDEKIHAFWGEQAFKLMTHPAMGQVMMKMAMAKQARAGGFGAGEGLSEQDLKKALEAMQALQAQSFDAAAPAPAPKSVKKTVTEAESDTAALMPAASKAPVADGKLAQMLEAVKESNMRTLQEYAFLPQDQQARIKAIMMETEEDLQDLVVQNADIETFVNVQMNLLITQQNKINQIVMEDISDREEF